MLTAARICSEADEDLDLPGDDGVVGAEDDNTEDAVNKIHRWMEDDGNVNIGSLETSFFFTFLLHKMDYFLL